MGRKTLRSTEPPLPDELPGWLGWPVSAQSWAKAQRLWPVFGALLLALSLAASAAAGAPSSSPKPASSIPAQAASRTPVDVRLGVREITPFIIRDDAKFKGFSADLWEEIAAEAELNTISTTVAPDVGSLIDQVEQKKVDVAIAAISITAERNSRIEFSQPMFESGLGIMTSVQGEANSSKVQGGGSLFKRVFSAVWTKDFLELVFWIFGLALIPAHIIYFLERRTHHGMLAKQKYLPGISEALVWSMTALVSQAHDNPRTKWGRGLSVVWMYFSVIFIAFFTAGVTSNLTTAQLLGSVNGPQDLGKVRVVTVDKSTAAKYLADSNISARSFSNIDQAVAALLDNKADAVVYDMPVLQYFETNRVRGQAKVVGGTFHTENYGIALPDNSPLRDRIDDALLRIRENGTYDELINRWFGQRD